MDSYELQKLARHARSAREAGMALILGSALLAVFLFVPLGGTKVPAPTAVATPTGPDTFAQIPLQAKAAIVYDLDTGETLYEKNADAQLPLASLTKLLAVYAALDALLPGTPVTIRAGATQLEAPRAFSAGQTFSFVDLARLTLTASLNDGAAAIVEAAAERENRSGTDILAGAAAALSLSQTYAVNGSGLDVSTAISGGYGSARDFARLAGALVKRAPMIAEATTQHFTEAISTGGTRLKVKNTDPMVDTIPRLLLSKTGYTDLAGGNLALVFDSGIGHPIAVVVLGSSEKARFTDGTALVAATIAHFAGVASL
ncbi:D-alanyl-D-alanine carboxypeptidase [Candidatus Kaiserbacteria bacterium]|nr:D-alanyl-D-alanine carboxypeptidase [Candidatus Kaiserbacteria bacterium]